MEGDKREWVVAKEGGMEKKGARNSFVNPERAPSNPLALQSRPAKLESNPEDADPKSPARDTRND